MCKDIPIELTVDGFEYNTLEIDVKYHKRFGRERGVFVSARPFMVKAAGDFGESRSCMMMADDGGFTVLVKPMERLHRKTLEAITEKIKLLDDSVIKGLFMAEHGKPSVELVEMFKAVA